MLQIEAKPPGQHFCSTGCNASRSVNPASTLTAPAQCPNFNALTMVSLAAAVMSITYSTIAFGASVAHGQIPNVQYNLDGFTFANGLFGVWNALGTVAFAYGGHNVVLEIQVCCSALLRIDFASVGCFIAWLRCYAGALVYLLRPPILCLLACLVSA